MDDKTVNSRFRQQLPFRVLVFGRGVTFAQSATGHVATEIEDDFKNVFESAKTQWNNRKAVWIEGPEQRSNFAAMKSRIQTKESVRNFLLFFIRQPVGLRLFIFDRTLRFERYIGRQSAINEAYLAWDSLTNWERDHNGKLKLSIACAGFRNRLAKYESDPDVIRSDSISSCMCLANVSDPTGLCGAHKKPGSHNIFNYYPFFATEGFPELIM